MTREDLEERLDKIVPPAQPLPAVARLVHWYPPAFAPGAPLPEPTAAIITRVHGGPHPGFVSLEGFGHDERVRHRGVPFSPTPRAGHWSWPPR